MKIKVYTYRDGQKSRSDVVEGITQVGIYYENILIIKEHIMEFRVVFWDILPCKMIVDLHGFISHKTTLNIILAAVRT
jgi:hypothetical protein